MKVLIITANFGGSALRNYAVQDSTHAVDIVSYNDDNFPSRKNALHPRLKGKIPKMLEWENKDYDYYIWLDSLFSISRKDCVSWMVECCKGADVCLFTHPSRNSVKDELSFMKSLMDINNGYLIGRYEGEPMAEQVASYSWTDDKLFACGAFIYSKKLVENKNYNLMKEWFHHNCIWSVQDQLSLPYLLEKFETKYNVFPEGIFNSQYIKYG